MRGVVKYSLVLWALGTSVAHADATLVYQLTESGAEPVEKRLSISHFFVRVDDPSEKDRYLLFQAGKFFPLYRVDESQRTYTLLTPPVKPTLHAGSTATAKGPAAGQTPNDTANPEALQGARMPGEYAAKVTPEDQQAKHQAKHDAAEPNKPAAATEKSEVANIESAGLAPSPQLKATKKIRTVTGIDCRIILELADDKPIIEHCMANKARLGITERESRTLARVFVLARQRGFEWLGAATADEDFVSLESRDLRRQKTLQLKSLSTDPLPVGYLRVPRSYKETKPTTEVKRPVEEKGAEAEEARPPQPIQGDGV